MRSQFPLMLRDFPRLQRVALTSAEKSVHLSRIKAGKVTYNYVMERVGTDPGDHGDKTQNMLCVKVCLIRVQMSNTCTYIKIRTTFKTN